MDAEQSRLTQGKEASILSRTKTMENTAFVTDREIYEKVILKAVPQCTKFLWLATSDLKDLYIHKGRTMVPFLELLADLASAGVSIRLLHASEPGPAFRRDFDRFPGLIGGMERILCPRVHFKAVVADGKFAYSGSANLTGAGMGAKSVRNRNFESGFVTTDRHLIETIMDQFDRIWMGRHCTECGRKKYCADYRDILDERGPR
ncbi:MAG: phospholipase D family protein [Chitinispirillaceae bacterium]|nr:phospholipase D family protein [Chitinispirillaceae bacterium]